MPKVVVEEQFSGHYKCRRVFICAAVWVFGFQEVGHYTHGLPALLSSLSRSMSMILR